MNPPEISGVQIWNLTFYIELLLATSALIPYPPPREEPEESSRRTANSKLNPLLFADAGPARAAAPKENRKLRRRIFAAWIAAFRLGPCNALFANAGRNPAPGTGN